MEETKNLNQGIDIVAATEEMLIKLQDNPVMNEKLAREVAHEAAPDDLLRVINKGITLGSVEFAHLSCFYVEVVIRRNEMIPENNWELKLNVFPVCPTPAHDTVVYKINNDGTNEFLWMIPSVKEGIKMLQDPLKVADRELFQNLLDFMDGTLRKKAKRLNGELCVEK